MPLLEVFLSLIVVGVLLWLVNTYIPMARSMKSTLNAVDDYRGCCVAAEFVWASGFDFSTSGLGAADLPPC